MSLWQPPQLSESMKKLDGMMPPTLVREEDGKNGECGPPPSCSMEAGAAIGFRMRSVDAGDHLRERAPPAGGVRGGGERGGGGRGERGGGGWDRGGGGGGGGRARGGSGGA